jgi:hypothetical protein
MLDILIIIIIIIILNFPFHRLRILLASSGPALNKPW